MWQIVMAELRYHRGHIIGFYVGAIVVAAAFGWDSWRSYFLYPELLLFSGILLHIVVLWGMDSERRHNLYASLGVSRSRAGLIQLTASLLPQLAGFVMGLALWIALIATGTITERADAFEAAWFLCAANGAALVFLLGWAHLAPVAEALRQDAPVRARAGMVLSVVIALGAAAWALTPWLAPGQGLSFPLAAALFHAIAVVLAILIVWMLAQRSEWGAPQG